MIRPIIKIHNATTNEVIEREMNDEEFAEYEAQQATYEAAEAARQAEAEAKAEARAALLAQLGITEEQAKLLLGGN